MRVCQTPDAMFHFHIMDKQIFMSVDNIPSMNLTEEQASTLEDELHDALESVLKQFWNKGV